MTPGTALVSARPHWGRRYLLGVLLVLSAEGHIHHKPARSWFYAQLTDSVVICRVTQMGLLRLLTNSKALGREVRSIRQAWDIQHTLEADPRVIFANDPETLQPVWVELMNRQASALHPGPMRIWRPSREKADTSLSPLIRRSNGGATSILRFS
jgi:hypothetical protein